MLSRCTALIRPLTVAVRPSLAPTPVLCLHSTLLRMPLTSLRHARCVSAGDRGGMVLGGRKTPSASALGCASTVTNELTLHFTLAMKPNVCQVALLGAVWPPALLTHSDACEAWAVAVDAGQEPAAVGDRGGDGSWCSRGGGEEDGAAAAGSMFSKVSVRQSLRASRGSLDNGSRLPQRRQRLSTASGGGSQTHPPLGGTAQGLGGSESASFASSPPPCPPLLAGPEASARGERRASAGPSVLSGFLDTLRDSFSHQQRRLALARRSASPIFSPVHPPPPLPLLLLLRPPSPSLRLALGANSSLSAGQQQRAVGFQFADVDDLEDETADFADEGLLSGCPGQVWQDFLRQMYKMYIPMATGGEVAGSAAPYPSDKNVDQGDGVAAATVAGGSEQRVLIRRGLGVAFGMHSGLGSEGWGPEGDGWGPNSDPGSSSSAVGSGFLACLLGRRSRTRHVDERYRGATLEQAHAIALAAYPGQVGPASLDPNSCFVRSQACLICQITGGT